jgi:hypothetical protein
MPITFTCPCGRQIRAKDGSAGRSLECPSCGANLEVPAPDAIDLGISLDQPSHSDSLKPMARKRPRNYAG